MAGADGSGLRTLAWTQGTVQNVLWSADQKFLYMNTYETSVSRVVIWKENVEGSAPEKLTETCGFTFAVAPGGQFLITLVADGERLGIYEYSLADRACTLLVPNVTTFGVVIDRDGKSFLYAVPTRRDVTIYRQSWQAGKAIGHAESCAEAPVCVSADQRRECV